MRRYVTVPVEKAGVEAWDRLVALLELEGIDYRQFQGEDGRFHMKVEESAKGRKALAQARVGVVLRVRYFPPRKGAAPNVADRYGARLVICGKTRKVTICDLAPGNATDAARRVNITLMMRARREVRPTDIDVMHFTQEEIDGVAAVDRAWSEHR